MFLLPINYSRCSHVPVSGFVFEVNHPEPTIKIFSNLSRILISLELFCTIIRPKRLSFEFLDFSLPQNKIENFSTVLEAMYLEPLHYISIELFTIRMWYDLGNTHWIAWDRDGTGRYWFNNDYGGAEIDCALESKGFSSIGRVLSRNRVTSIVRLAFIWSHSSASSYIYMIIGDGDGGILPWMD